MTSYAVLLFSSHCGTNYDMNNRINTILSEAAFIMVTNLVLQFCWGYVTRGLALSEFVASIVLVCPIAWLVRLEYRRIIEMQGSPEPVVKYYGAQIRYGAPRWDWQRDVCYENYQLQKCGYQISQGGRYVPARKAATRRQMSSCCDPLGERQEIVRRCVVCYEDRQAGDASTRTRNQQLILCTQMGPGCITCGCCQVKKRKGLKRSII